MEGLEFYLYESELWCKSEDGRNWAVTENDTELIQQVLSMVREQFPEAYHALEQVYKKSAGNPRYYQFLMFRRFIKCNFGKLDSTSIDITKCGSFCFEKVDCPLRGECAFENVICSPKFNSTLSRQELRVMKLMYEGKNKEEISSELYISPNTVKNHIKSVYTKLGIHEKSEFIQYANKNHLFNI